MFLLRAHLFSPFGPSYPLLRLRRRLDVVQSHRHHRPVHEILHVENEARLGNATRVKDRKGRRGAEGKINWRFSTVDPQWEDGWGERVTAVPSGERNQIFIDSLEGKMYRGEMTDRSSVAENGAMLFGLQLGSRKRGRIRIGQLTLRILGIFMKGRLQTFFPPFP